MYLIRVLNQGPGPGQRMGCRAVHGIVHIENQPFAPPPKQGVEATDIGRHYGFLEEHHVIAIGLQELSETCGCFLRVVPEGPSLTIGACVASP